MGTLSWFFVVAMAVNLVFFICLHRWARNKREERLRQTQHRPNAPESGIDPKQVAISKGMGMGVGER